MDKINWTWLHQEMGGFGSGDGQDLIQIALPFGMSLAVAIAHRLVASGKRKSLVSSENASDTRNVSTELDEAANLDSSSHSTPAATPVDSSNPNTTLSQQQLTLALAEKVRQLEEQLVTERVAHTTQVEHRYIPTYESFCMCLLTGTHTLITHHKLQYKYPMHTYLIMFSIIMLTIFSPPSSPPLHGSQVHTLEQHVFSLHAQNNKLSQDLSTLLQQKNQLDEQLTLTRLSKVQEVTELHSQLYLQQHLPASPLAAGSVGGRQKSPSGARRSKSPTWKRTSQSTTGGTYGHPYSPLSS
ncbi:hypothetical protein EON65_30085 [archaeon]|nr:MAG: hypothetical protein EON65_30085 [archaeon]